MHETASSIPCIHLGEMATSRGGLTRWQAKLVPVTSRLDDSLGELRPPFRAAISRLVPVAPSLRTH